MTSKECRICLRFEQNCVSLFAKRRGTKLAEIVRFCARVEISEDDGLPGDACGRCVEEALNAYLFVNKCRRSDAELRTAQANFKEEFEEDDIVDPRDDGPPDASEVMEDDSQIEPVAEVEERDHTTIETESMHVQHVIEKTEANEIEAAETASLSQESIQYDVSMLDEEMDLIELRDPPGYQQLSGDTLEVDVPPVQVKNECFNEICEEDESNNREDQYLVEYLDDNFRDDFSDAIEDAEFAQEDESERESLQGSPMTDGVKHVMCCGIRCRAVFDSIQELTKHSTEVHLPSKEPESKEKPYECHRCYARFNSEKSVTMHTRKLQHCTICLQICFSIKEKRLHMHQVHGETTAAAEKQSSQQSICCGCHEAFESVKDLRTHSEEVHSIRKSAMDETKPFQCDICYKLFRTFESLRIHQRFVYRPKNFVCTVCLRAFDTRSKLQTHELVHSNKRNFQCDKCDKSFKKDIDLKSHLLLHEEKREVCNVCGLKFHRKSNLKMHMRKHQNTFFYACPECPKKFKNNSHLKEHFKVHSKQKPYPCSFCERSFGYCSDRKRHEMTHTGNYPFECSCSKKFARKTTYEKHVAHCQESSVGNDVI